MGDPLTETNRKLSQEERKRLGDLFESVLNEKSGTDYEKASIKASKSIVGRLREWGSLIQAVVFLTALGGGMFLVYFEIPNRDEVHETIEERVVPIEEFSKNNAKTIQKIDDDVEEIQRDVKRAKDVQEVVLEQNAYQGKVLEHVANKKRGKPPSKPEGLEAKESDLMK